MLIKKLKNIYIQEQFQPSLLSIFFNPYYFARKSLYSHFKLILPNFKGSILDVGCGQKPYQRLCPKTDYIGLEIDTSENRKNKRADFFYDGTSFPFKNNSFDGILTSQVFEHVFTPEVFLKEVNRCLKKEGSLLLSVPFVWDEHEQPHDYARYSSFGIKSILEKNGFKILESRKSLNDIRVIFQLVIAYWVKVINPKNNFIRLLLHSLISFPMNFLGEILYRIFPSNPDLYLDNIVLAKKVQDV